MAEESKGDSVVSARDKATEDLFNQGLGNNRRVRDLEEEYLGDEQQHNEELFKQNLQGRVDDQKEDLTDSSEQDYSPEFSSTGFSFTDINSFSELPDGGTIPAGTELATLELPVSGGNFSFSLDSTQFTLQGNRLSTLVDLTPVRGQQLGVDIRVTSNDSDFTAQIPVEINFDNLAEALQSEQTFIDNAPSDINLSDSDVAEGAVAGDFVATILATDDQGADQLNFSLTGEGANIFEVSGNTLVVAPGVTLDFETRSEYPVEITVTDASGNAFTKTITVNLTDVNEAPVLQTAEVTVAEDQGVINASMVAEDQDAGDQLTFTAVDPDQLPVGFILQANGDYSFDATSGAYDHLGAGDSQQLTIPVRVTDSEGLQDTAFIKITIAGTNDAPVAGADIVSSLDEGATAIGGQLTATDADDGAVITFTVAEGVSLPAGFSLGAQGEYSFDPADSAYQRLGAGDSQVITVPVTVTDEHGATDTQQIRITVKGTNDAPVAGADISAAVEEGSSAISGQLIATDADDGSILTFAVTPGADTPAGFSLDADGNYSFEPDAGAYQHLAVGDSQVLTIPVTVTDELGATDVQQIQITVAGTNDSPVADADVHSTVLEGDSVISGQLSATDVDDSAVLTFSVTDGVTVPAGFSLNTDGSYSFDPRDAAYDSMDAGDEQTLTIPVTVSDENGATTTQQIQIKVTGTNDEPVAGANATANVNEGDTAISGQLSATDADESATLTFSVTEGATVPAGFSLNTDGSYSFNPQDAAYDSMDAGDEQTLTIPVTVSDENGATATQQIQIKVTGTNDEPVAGANATANVDEGDAVISGQLSATDADDSAVLTFSVTEGATVPAGFSLNTDGSYSFNPQDAAYGSMDAGDEQTLTIPVTVSDEHGDTATQQIQIKVTGTNDEPVAGANATANVNEGDAAISGQLSATDVDDSAVLTFSVTEGATVPAGFSLNSDGSYSFDPQDAAYDSMDAGDEQTLTIPVTVSDENGATATQQIQIKVTGTNDEPVAGANATANVNEGDAAISGQLSATDADDSAVLTFSVTEGATVPAGFSLDADGTYSFDPRDAAYDSMDAGDEQTLTIPVTVSDENGATATQQIQIKVTGTNDEPVAGANATANVNEGDAAISGQLSATDADDSAVLTFSVTEGATVPAGFSLNSDGSYSFNPQDAAYDSMDAGDEQTLTIPVTVSDENGATATQQIQIKVTGTNDEPVAGANATANVNEGDAAISGQLSATDADDSAILTFSVTEGATVPAGFTLNSDGSYSFDPQDAAYDSMDAGDEQTLTIPVTVSDENGATATQQIQIKVTGTNDEPVAGANATANVNEGDAAISGQLSATDADDSAVLNFSVTEGATVPAGFTLNSDGSYSFNPQDAAYDSMDAGDEQTLTIPVTVSDENGATATQQIQIKVTGTNDEPVAGANATANVNEGDAAISGQLSATDVDDSATLTFSVTDGATVPAGFTLNADGSYSFNPQDAAYDSMDAGDEQTLTIPVTVSDEHGATAIQQIQIKVTGTNDEPVAGANATANVNEGDAAISGQLSATDADDSAVLTFSVTEGATVPAGFSLNADGSYSFDPQDAAYDGMDAGDEQTLTIPVTVSDENGATATQQIQIKVTGTNDEPVAGANATANVNEDDAAISGQLSATDADESATLTFSVTDGATVPAGFSLNTDGSYSFDPQDTAYDSMDAGDEQTLTIPVTVSDENGATATQQIQIKVTGTNDEPVAGANATANVDEGDAVISGQLSATDADDSAVLTFSVTEGATVPAGFSLNTDGSYSFNPQDAAYDSMDAGDEQTLTIPVTVSDEHGDTATQQIQIKVTGTNDEPVAGANATANVNEGDAAISGQLSATDVDDSAVLTFSVTEGATVPAGFSLDADGSYSFDPRDAAYDSMDAGDEQTLTIPVTVSDENGATATQQIQIKVTGTNDEPVAEANATANVDEGDTEITGQLSATDVDDSAVLTFSVTDGATVPAGFTLNTDGSYSFDPQDAAYDSMDAGDEQTLTIPVTVSDENGATATQQIQIKVTGTNDEPVAGANATANVNEGDAAISGQLSATDADDSAVLTFSVTEGATVPAGFTLNTDGSYSFDPQDAAYDGMDAGDEQTLTIPVTVSDENGATATQQIQIKVTGTNDAPVAGANATANVNEGDAAISGQLSATDVDDSAVLTFSVTEGATVPAGFSLNVDGSYSFDPRDAAYDSMDAGDEQTLTIPVTVSDENGATATQQIQIKVTGTNDEPVAGANATANVNEGDAAISGQLSATDVDESANLTFSVTEGTTVPAGFSLNTDGSYSFDPQDAAYDSMDAGDEQTLTIPVTVSDEHGATATQQIQIKVTGTNDEPVAGANATANVNEGDAAISGQLSATDADDSAVLTFSVTEGVTVPPGFSLNADGSYSFDPRDAAYDSMDAGDEQTLTIPVTVSDENGATATQQIQIKVTGTNDEPVAGANATANVNEGDTAISGQLSATDADDSAVLTFSVTEGATVPAGFTLNTDGSYSFNPQDAAYDSMDSGDEQTLTIPVTVSDEHGATATQQIQIKVTGTNDEPVAGANATANVNEGDAAISGQLSATDVDESANLTFSVTEGATVPAGFTLNTDGSYSFNPQDAAYDSMDAGDEQTLTIPVTVSDENGATATQQIQIKVTGTNDEPVAGANATANVNEGDAAISGQLSATDVDDSAVLTFSVTEGATVPAGFSLDADGSYSFDPQDAAYDSMDAGDEQTLTIPVTVSDESGATATQQIQIKVTGTNDEPVAGANATANVNEGDAAISGQLSATDADDSAVLTFSVTEGATVPAGFTLNTDGSYSFDPQDAAYDGMDAGDEQTLTIPVTVSDENGATATQQIQIKVTGTNDAPVAGANATANVNEGDAAISGQLSATDADDSAVLTFSVTDGATVPAGFTLNSDGSYSFDPQDAAYDSLSAGEVQTLAIPVTVTDQQGASDTQLINITVNGTNDAPVANTETISGLEDKAVVFTTSALLGNDSDADGGTLSIDSFEQPDNGTLAFDAVTNTFTFTPDDNWSGNTAFQYSVADGQGGLTNASSTIEVAGVADEPNLTVQVGQAVDGTVERTISFDNSSNDYNPEKDGFQFKNMYAHNDQGLASTGYSGTVPPEFQESDGNTFALKTLVLSSNGNPHADTNRNSESKEITFKAYDEDGNVVGTHTVTTIAQDNATSVVNFTGVPGFGDVFRVAMEFDGSGDRYINIDDVVVDVHEGNSIPLNISSSLGVDTDGSESLSGVVLSGIPADATLSAGTKNADGDWVVPQSDLDGLSVKVPSETTRFTLEASVTSTESGSGDTFVKTVTVAVNNSAPVAAEHTGAADEDGAVVSGTLSATDADNDSLSYTLVEGGQPSEGSVTINTDGSYSFDPGSDFQDLGAGQTREVSFSYQVSDGFGGSVTGVAKVIVTGTNDGPEAGPDVVFNLFEGAAPATGQLAATDVDNGSVLTFGVSEGVSAPAGFTLNADGSFIFNPQHSAYDSLDQGDVQTLTIPVTVTDDQGATDTQHIRITVTGQNDAPVAGADIVSIVDEGAAALTGQLSATDADDSAVLTFSVTEGATVPAGFSLNADGSYSFNPQNAAYDSMDAGDEQTLTIPVTVSDEHGVTATQQIQIKVTGTNDEPVAGANATANVNEGDAAIFGQLSATDVDDSAVLTFSVTEGATVPAGFSLNADGSYSFNPQDVAYDSMDAGDEQTLTIPVTVSDEDGGTATQQIQIKVTGTNDEPVAGANATANVNEGDAVISGQLSATDADDSATLTFSVTDGATVPAGFSLNADGSYSFDPQDAAYDGMDAGDEQTLTIPVTVSDEDGGSATQQIQIKVTGTNDEPVAGANATANVNEGDAAISGQLSATDVDDSAVLTFSVTEGATVPAGFSLNADGSYSFNPQDAAYDSMDAGDEQTLTIPVTVSDEDGGTATQQIQIKVTGTNDEPVAGANATANVNEGDTAISGQLSATDADDSAVLTFSVTEGATVPAGFSLNADGSYSFNPQNAAYDSMDAGDEQTLTIPVTVSDEHGATAAQQIQIKVTGTNDEPVAGANATANVNEGDAAISGQLSATDVDDSATWTFSVTDGAGIPAGFSLNSDGSYSFNPQDAAYDSLDAGDVQTLTIPVTVTDEHGATDNQQIRITVTGTNDEPVAGANATANVNEGDTAISGQLSATDVDDSAVLTFSVTEGATVPAGFSLNTDGSYSFNPQDAAYDSMDAGDEQTLTIPVTVSDEHGATTTQQIQIKVTGTNDEPVAGANATANVNEGDAAISGQLSATDVDDSATWTFSVTDGAGIPAGFSLNSDGSYSFNPQDAAYDSLDAGDVQTLTIPVTVTDEHGATDNQQIRITVTGTNDEPVAGANATANVNEGDAAISGQLSATDVDDSAVLTFSVTEGATVPAGFSLNTDGSYSFNPQDAAYDSMDAGDEQTLTIPVTVSDENGATTTQQIQIKVTGTNDEPVAGANATANVNEGDAAISGQLSATDVDDSATWTFSVTDGAGIPAGFSLNSDGSYSFNPQDAAYDSLDAGDVQTLTIPVTVTDEKGATDTQQIQIKVNGTNDAPVAGADISRNVAEDAPQLSGSFSGTDADSSASLSYTLVGSAPAGFNLSADGSYTFDPADDSYQHLAAGDSQTLTIPVTVSDEKGATDVQQLQIVLSGTNDAPVMSVVQPVSVDVPEASVATTTTLFSSTFDGSSSGFVQSVDGWETDSEAIEVWTSINGHTGDGSFLELNDDKANHFDDAEQVSRSVDTVEGATYTLDFDFAGRAGFGANVNNMQVKVNGQVIDTFSDDASGQSDHSWNDGQITFVGTGQPMEIEFVSIGEAQDYGRGMRLDNIELTQTVMDTPDATISGQLQATDIDDNSTVTFAVEEGAVLPAGFTLNTDGSYSFDPADAAYENIPDGTSQVLSIPVVASDGLGGTATQSLQITVNGTAEGAPAASVVANDDNFAEMNAAIVKTGGNISNLGDMGQGQVDGVAQSDIESRTFDFGADYAGQTVTLSFDSRVTGSWDDGSTAGITQDTFTIRVNGQQVDQRTYDSDSDSDDTWNSSHSYQVTLDSNGQAVVEFDVASTWKDEVVSVSNLQMEKAAAYATDEDTAVTLNVLGNDTGSNGNNLSISSFDNQVMMNGMVVGTVEKVVVGGLEQLKFTPNDNLDSLNAGESATLSFDYTLTGSQGGSDTATATFKVQGTDDAYVFDTSNVGTANTDTSGLNRIDGTGSKDNIKGTSSDDYILGVNGDDKLEGKDGNDVLDGGDGKDHLKGGDGDDTLYGRDGDDHIDGDDGNDYIDGGEGDDKLHGKDGNDQILGGAGDDELKGDKGDDLLLGGAGDDDIKGGDGDDVLSGGKGDDTVKGEAGNDTYVYNPFDGNDTFSGGKGGGWTDIIQLTQDGTNDPENPWTITVDGQEVEYDLAAQALELNPDTSGVVTMADGSELTFEGVEKIEW
ncbi:VCBS domain-containing protein [Aliamphritea hakodatensis]|uniref:VCBS domain-containing protein n=1 Tax=Aliamphritea hakodatensis TaxID=2895352 RepID=UPI0022FD9D0F|nr:VCBS domain-containing protein [Aliamphritea hakodatensis]